MATLNYYVDTDVVGELGDGSSWANAYSNLNAAISGKAQDLTDSGGDIAVFHCKGSAADTTAVTISGWTTSSTSYIQIQCDAADRHPGTYSTSKYRLEVAGTCIEVQEEYVRFDGLQIKCTGTGSNLRCINVNTSGTSVIAVNKCISWATGHPDQQCPGFGEPQREHRRRLKFQAA